MASLGMRLLDETLNLVLPVQCIVCGHCGVVSAWRVLCAGCAEALPSVVVRVSGPVSVAYSYSLGPYEGPLGVLIREAKYGRNLGVIDRLGRHLGLAITGRVEVDAVVPIPIPTVRRWVRGFDQGERLGLGISAVTGLPMRTVLSRRRGPPQVGKGSSERRKLPVCTMSVSDGVLPDRIVLVDDVRTTGATLHAAARALRRRGVSHICAITLSHQDM